ncbi:hypothetical protein D1BOALGB6SA_4681 [Olavius sp. associated proteobacterium Delta 1]|nr:hypothetical protein D1BOALGB6SA_4681 [Olavius sp. associated proteobacterium Delta 1]
MNFSECLKLQNVSGKEGYISKAFINLPFQYLNDECHDEYLVLLDNLKVVTKSIANF